MKNKNLEVLIKLVKILEKNKINYTIIGSTALFLQGIKLNPKDIDILTNKTGIQKVEKIFRKVKKEGITAEHEELKHSKYFSYYAKFKIEGIDVEFLANTKAVNKKTGAKHRSNLKLKKYINFKEKRIAAMPIEEELRAKEIIMWKPNKIKLIKNFLKKN